MCLIYWSFDPGNLQVRPANKRHCRMLTRCHSNVDYIFIYECINKFENVLSQIPFYKDESFNTFKYRSNTHLHSSFFEKKRPNVQSTLFLLTCVRTQAVCLFDAK